MSAKLVRTICYNITLFYDFSNITLFYENFSIFRTNLTGRMKLIFEISQKVKG